MDCLEFYIQGLLTRSEFDERKLIGRHVCIPHEVVASETGTFPKKAYVGRILTFVGDTGLYNIEIIFPPLAIDNYQMKLRREQFHLFYVGRHLDHIAANSEE
mgnify:CR=1 FL=1